MKTLIIDERHDNQRLDKYLKKLLVNAPSGLVHKMIRRKDVKVNGQRAKENQILRKGDEVSLFLYDDRFEEYTKRPDIVHVDQTFEVVHEDEHILIVDKPAGLRTQKATRDDTNNLNAQVLSYLYDTKSYDPHKDAGFTPAAVHRLDKDTSGLVLIGKDLRALQDLSEMMKSHDALKKTYVTIVKGHLSDGTYEAWCVSEDGRMRVVDKNHPKAMHMVTKVHVLDQSHDASLVEVTLLTGRKHQIRLHLSSLAHPVLGDPIYGDKSFNRTYKRSTHVLTNERLVFVEPVGSLAYLKGQTFKATLPKATRKLISHMFETK